jgi:hypothetical protein
MKICVVCNEVETKKGKSWCTSCQSAYRKEHYKNNKETYLLKATEWRKNNPEKRKSIQKEYRKRNPLYYKDWQLKKFYGFGLDKLEDMIVEEGGLCPICGDSFDEVEANVDHNHTTGKIRGILCPKCNMGIGHFRDNISFLEKAIFYLEKRD